LKPGNKVVLLPLGSFEQHGRHLPLTTDTDIVTAVARGVERKRVNKILCLPALWPVIASPSILQPTKPFRPGRSRSASWR
jgi:creatinine amidohydrolase/Fe(II)-dependent formamide hydrolase-like protein